MSDRNKGYLITLEGPEGAGKTTAIKEFSYGFQRRYGISPRVFREPGGTRISEEIGKILREKSYIEMDYMTEALLFQAARAQITQEILTPHLDFGHLVILDRFIDSSLAYQGAGRELGFETIRTLNEISTKGLKPDLTLLFDIDVELGLSRKVEQGKMERLDNESITFHETVREAYLDMLWSDKSGRWELVDASMPLNEVVDSMQMIIEGRLIGEGFIEGSLPGVERVG
jgi:dTMP kinase